MGRRRTLVAQAGPSLAVMTVVGVVTLPGVPWAMVTTGVAVTLGVWT